tara:strand:+ start:35 stop:631 length:597 start_codon:yes stop_codon:yes gene_type:complete
MNYETAQGIKKMWNEELIPRLKENREEQMRIYKDAREQLKKKDEMLVETREDRKLIIEFADRLANTNALANVEEKIKKLENCRTIAKGNIKLVNIDLKIISYAHNEDLGNVVKHYHLLKEQCSVVLEITEEFNDQIYSYMNERKGKPKVNEGAYIEIAGALKTRIETAETLMTVLTKLEIAKEVKLANKKARKRNGKK